MQDEPYIAIIPARGGSKRIPKKNVKPFLGIPMIERSIKVALESRLFSAVIVSTDSAEVAELAEGCGAVVPFTRPAGLSDDHTPTAPVIKHALSMLPPADVSQLKAACCVYPCAPLMRAEDLSAGLALLRSTHKHFVYPVCKYDHPIQRALTFNADGSMQFWWPENELKRTQDLTGAWHDAGMFYWGTIEGWLSGARMHSNAAGLELPSWRVVDIDDESDWVRAEQLFRATQIGS